MYNVANSTVKSCFAVVGRTTRVGGRKNLNFLWTGQICQLLANFDWAEPRTIHIKML